MSVVTADVIVLGLGAMGAAAFRNLAARRLRVIGIERFSVAHAFGSSHGETRIIRKAYFEHPDYVPLLRRAYELWSELEAVAGHRLYHETGLLLAGPPDGEVIPGAKLAADRHGITIDCLSPAECGRRFSWLDPPAGMECVYEPQAGFLEVERCVEAQIRAGETLGGQALCNERVIDWASDGSKVRIITDKGRYEANLLVVCAGPWTARMLVDLRIPLEVVRKPSMWFRSRRVEESPSCGFLVETEGRAFYGVPSLEPGVTKLAEHTSGDPVDPECVDRVLRQDDMRPVQSFARSMLKGIELEPVRSSVCLYTLTPDRHFVIDRHRDFGNVAFACGFSGHGFKFAPVVGEALADLATEGTTALPIGFLRNRWPGGPVK